MQANFARMLQAKGLHKNYGQLQVLKGLDLEVNDGEIMSIVGASGAGKTTLLKILGTLEHPSSGEVFFKGEPLFSKNAKNLARFRNRHLGFVFQFHQLLPEFNALENVTIPSIIAGTDRKEAKDKAHALLQKLGVDNRAKAKPSQLSGGEQQRVAVARALINEPALILADEPTGNLDSSNGRALYDLIIELRETMGQTFVIVTHNEKHAGLADRVVRISDGRIVGQ